MILMLLVSGWVREAQVLLGWWGFMERGFAAASEVPNPPQHSTTAHLSEATAGTHQSFISSH